MACRGYLIDRKTGSEVKSFDSESALDLGLAERWDEVERLKKRSEETFKAVGTVKSDHALSVFEKYGFKVSKVFDISPAEKTDIILNEHSLKVKEIISKTSKFDGIEDEFVKLHDHPDYIGVTELISTFGNPKLGGESPIVSKFEREEKITELIRQFRSDGETEEDAIEFANNVAESGDLMAEYGDDVHAIYQAVFQETPVPKMKHLTDGQVKEVTEQAEAFKENLLSKDEYKGAKFYSELNIATLDIDPDLKEIFKNAGRTENGISGTIDLLVRRSDGKVEIFDFKTSHHSPGEDNTLSGGHSNKRTAVTNQLAAYANLLQQLEIAVASTHIVPIKMDYLYDKEHNLTGVASITRETTLNNIPGTLGDQEFKNGSILIPSKFDFKVETIDNVDRGIQFVLPVQSVLSQKIEKETADENYYKGKVFKLSPTDPQAIKNGKRYKYKFYPRELGKEPIFGETEDEMNEGIKKYVAELKEARAKELDTIATNIQRAMIGDITIDDIDGMLSENKKGFLKNQISRYINNGGRFVRDKNLNAFGIFIFQKDGRSEVVGITNQPLGTAFKLSKGSSILGKTRYDKDVNSKDILDATTGNMELMRLMMYISENQETFKNNKITQIKVLNPGHGSQYVELNSVLKNNYNLLVQDNAGLYDGTMKRITEDIFYGDVTSILSISDELLADFLSKDGGLYEFDRNDLNSTKNKQITEEWITKQIRNLQRTYTYLNSPDIAGTGDSRVWEAYNNLLRALLAVRGNRMVQEFDVDAYLNSGLRMGTAINSTGYSPSANIRIFDDIMQDYATEVRVTVEKMGRPVVQALDAFYKSKGKNRIIGGEYTTFKEGFNLNPDGSINESFTLKDPSDASLSRESSHALKVGLETMAKLRGPNATPEDIQKLKESGEYYEVPLTEASFKKQAKSLGVLSALRNKLAQYKELTEDVFAGETSKKMDGRSDFDRNGKLYNKFELYDRNKSKQEVRAEKLAGNVGFFETDLEEVMNQALTAYVKSNVSTKYIPRLNALSISLRLSATYGGQRQIEVEKILNQLIDSKFYGESIIPGETMQAFARGLNVIKKGLSFMSLGGNMRSMLRETLQGTGMGISRAGLNNMPGITKETYMKGYMHVLTHAHENFSSVSLLQQLDALMGVANYSLGNIARKRKLDGTGIRNGNTDTAFGGSTSPDFQHRMALIVAKMMGDGCWEAHSLNKDGDLVYDWTVDKRFSIYAKGMTLKDSEAIQNYAKANPEFANQRSLYMEHISELNRTGKKFKDELGFEREYQEGDALPQAYLPREVQAMKNYADLLYGHYDDESRSLIHDTFLGSFFMQYKTYITSRIEQGTLNPGTYNTELLQWETDPVTGEHLYKIHHDLDEDGRPNIEIKRESQIENLDQLLRENKAEKYYVGKGIPMEGIARSYINFFKRFKELGGDNFKELKNNPIERDNLLLGLHDTLFASFMLLLITGLFGLIIDGEGTTDHNKIAQEARKNGGLSSFSYNVVYGSFTDFAVWNNAWSIVGDGNPPALTAGKRLVENSGAVILGKKSVFQAVTNTGGAAADLKGLADRLADQ